MSNLINLEALDQDGAIRDAHAAVAGDTRADFLKKAGLAGAGIVAGGALFGALDEAEARISRRKSKKNDVAILNFALTLEFLEAAFYREAVANNVAKDPALKRFADVVAEHEADHVTFLRKALGRAAVKSPKFDFQGTTSDEAKFKATAQVLEDTGVTAYLGQAGNILQTPVLAAAGSIVTVEARHAGWIRFINSGGTGSERNLPAPATFDRPKTEAQILRAVAGTKFITR